MKSALKIFGFLLLVLTSVFAIGFSEAEPITINSMWVYFNTHLVDDTTIFSVERGNTLSVKVFFETGEGDLTEVRVKAWIDGYRDEIEAETERFDIDANRAYSKTLYLNLPDDMEDGLYTVHIIITSKTSLSGDSTKEITLAVQRTNYKAEILSVDLALPAVVEAGKTLAGTAVIKNRGSHKLEDVYVRVEINELGLVKTIYIGDLYAKDYEDLTERDTKTVSFSLKIPQSAESKEYSLKVYAYNLDTTTQTEASFEVQGKEIEETQIALTAINEEISLKAGETATYEVVLVNLGEEALSLNLEVVGLEGWATAQVSEESLVLNPKESKKIEIELATQPTAVAGTHVFSVQVKKDEEVIGSKNLAAKIEVIEKENKVGLWVALGILIAIALALLIALIIILVKQRKETEEKPEEIYY